MASENRLIAHNRLTGFPNIISRHHLGVGGLMFKNINVPLRAAEHGALILLSSNEMREIRYQAALIIRRELERLGYIQPQTEAQHARDTQPA